MAIGTDAVIGFVGTQDDLDSSSAAVTDGSFSIASDLAQWTNDDDAVAANFIFEGTYSTAPDANSVVDLFLRPLNIEGTNEPPVPDANNLGGYVGSFQLNDQTAIQQQILTVSLLPFMFATSQVFEVYIRNRAGQTVSAGWTIFVLPIAVGPHP